MKKQATSKRFSLLDSIFVWGIIFAPMTALRAFKFGPGEILLIIWMVFAFFKQMLKKQSSKAIVLSKLNRYQLANLLMMIIGMFVNVVVYREIKTFRVLATDYFSHVFMFLLSVSILNSFNERNLTEINAVIKRVVFLGAIIYGGLLIYATYYSTVLFGHSLWMGYRTRFLGLAQNPHQIGMITGAAVFFSLYLMSTQKNMFSKLFFLALAGVWYWISVSTKSDTMRISYIICAVGVVFHKITKLEKNPAKRTQYYVILAIILVIGVALFSGKLMSALSGFVEESKNGEDRLVIWETGFGQLINKPIGFITGLGPGAHTGRYMAKSGNEIEAHNTYIQLILNSGIFICLYYVYTIYNLVKKPFIKNTYLVIAVLYFACYGFGGNMNRRVLVWFTYTMVLILFEKTAKTEVSQK